MSYRYRRNSYRRPRYYHRPSKYGGYSYPFRPVQGIFVIGVAFILLGSLGAIIQGNISKFIIGIIYWAILLFVVVLVIKVAKTLLDKAANKGFATLPYKITNEFNEVSVEVPVSENSAKHGCKCYMENLLPGEQVIANILSDRLNYKDYFIFNNVTIPSERIGSSQIDHLVISRYGIFVIESKNYQGWIFGRAHEAHWTHSMPGGKVKIPFQNPIYQNFSHIKSLCALLPSIKQDNFFNIVVFNSVGKFMSDSIENVVSSDELISAIDAHTDEKLSDEEVQLVLGKLAFECQTADITHEGHVENLRTYHSLTS